MRLEFASQNGAVCRWGSKMQLIIKQRRQNAQKFWGALLKISWYQKTCSLFSILPKNEQKTSTLVARANLREYFVCFLEVLKPRKIASKIIWPLIITFSLWITLEESANRIQPLKGPLEQSSVSTTLIRSGFFLSPDPSS